MDDVVEHEVGFCEVTTLGVEVDEGVGDVSEGERSVFENASVQNSTFAKFFVHSAVKESTQHLHVLGRKWKRHVSTLLTNDNVYVKFHSSSWLRSCFFFFFKI